MASIWLSNVTKRFGKLTAVDDVSFEVASGELLCLLGPSGCGKTTVLRMMGGFEDPTSGSVFLDGQDITDKPPYERNTSMVFQSWALFPQKSVIENVAFGLKMAGLGKSERKRMAQDQLEMVQLGDFADYRPDDLSGGQKQRVALARSLIIDPDVLLLDEPLSNLDKRLREEMQIELKRIHDEIQTTFVYVTHDQDEAFTLADRIGVMNNGRLEQIGDPRDVYNEPNNRFIEGFLGETNFFEGTIEEEASGAFSVSTDAGITFSIGDASGHDLSDGDSVSISLRPERINLVSEQELSGAAVQDGGDIFTEGTVVDVIYRGGLARYYVDIGSYTLFLDRMISEVQLAEGDVVSADWTLDDVVLFDDSGETIRLES